jgi:glycosyltransferase involved in cell wall biosynthesis
MYLSLQRSCQIKSLSLLESQSLHSWSYTDWTCHHQTRAVAVPKIFDECSSMSDISDNLRVLMLATYFPKPGNPLMGNWALAQAQALGQQHLDLNVVSLTSWVPKILAKSGGAKAYADCPTSFDWAGLNVNYPKGLWYPIPPLKHWEYSRPAPFLRLAWACLKPYLMKVCEQSHPHVIYAHHTAVNGYFANRLREHLHIPYVITDNDHEEISDCGHLKSRKRFLAPIVENAACMVGVSRRLTTDLLTLFPSARTRTVHNGSDPIPETTITKERPIELVDKTVVFSCGAFYARKAIPDLITAFAPVARNYPNVVLRIAGDGPERSLVEARIREHQLVDRVTLLGFRSHHEVLQEMVWSDIFALVSRSEPFATVYTEALSAGKPIVCCSDGGISDVVRDHQEALIVSPGDTTAGAAALEELVGNLALRRRMGAAAEALFLGKLTWQHNAQIMKQIFSNAVEQREGYPYHLRSSDVA